MDKKKILIVSRSFYPENSPRSHRTTELAKEFAREGHEVTVITPKDEQIHTAFAQEHKLTIKDLGKQRWKTPDFGKSRIGYLLTRAFVRFFGLAFEYPHIELMYLVCKALKKESGYELLISIAVPYPVHWGVAKVWNKKQKIAKTWVADCSDPYMGCETDSFRKWFYFKYVEKWFMRKADFVTIPVESARNAYYPEFHDKINIIPQGFQFTPIKQPTVTVKHDVPTFAYAGGFIQGIRDPRPFLDYLTTIGNDFRFFIFTNNRSLIDGYLQKLKGKLEIRDYISREELLTFLAGMDFLVNIDNNSGTALPSKLIDYAICSRPVLNIKKTLDTDIIRQFMTDDYHNAMEIGNIDQYRIENVCTAFLALSK